MPHPIAVFAGLALANIAAAVQSPSTATLTNAVNGAAFTLHDFADQYVIVDVLPQSENAAAEQIVREHVPLATSLAGTRLVFVKQGDAASVREWWSGLGLEGALVAADVDAAAASAILGSASNPASSATIVFAKDGHELFRSIGASPAQFLSATELASRLDAATGATTLSQYNLAKGKPLAVDGYDVVAYFTDHKALKGSPAFVAHFEGVMYQFASAEHRSLFVKAPDRYLPTYGGWFASAMGAKGTKVEIDPTNFKVKDGRLFLFYKSLFGDALKDWNQHEAEWKPAADANWKKTSGESPIKPPR